MKEIAVNYPGCTMAGSLCGYFVSFIDALPGIMRLVILLASTITAVSMAYVQYNKALKVNDETKKRDKG